MIELRAGDADKGTAVRAVMARLAGFATWPVFVGDDDTDETAFTVAAELGGFGVLVGKPRPSAARFRLGDVSQVRDWRDPHMQPYRPDLNLWPIGNCQVSALINAAGRFVWACVPRVDGEPLFSALLDSDDPQAGFWDIKLEGATETNIAYVRNTPVLITRHRDDAGNAIEIVDFCPDYQQGAGHYRPVAFARIVHPVHGSPRIRVRLRPMGGWGELVRPFRGSGNYLRFRTGDAELRLTTSEPLGLIQEERVFRLERPAHFFLGPDEPFLQDIDSALDAMLERTASSWRSWVRGLAIPLEWQSAVIRSAITLKLCQHAETGAIVAALTTSIPEHPGSERNWDYRFCWIRDAYQRPGFLRRTPVSHRWGGGFPGA